MQSSILGDASEAVNARLKFKSIQPLRLCWDFPASFHLVDRYQLASAADIYPLCFPNGRWAYYQNLIGNQLKRVPIGGSLGRQITIFPSDKIQSFSYSPDGESLGVLRFHTVSDVILLTDSASAAQ